MDTRKIRKLIELVKETGIGELEVKSGEESVRISTQPPSLPFTTSRPLEPILSPTPATAQEEKSEEAEPKHKMSPNSHKITSPMVGTVYLAPEPGSPPFVAIGQRIKPGDTLCLIEAMKMFNKIEADKEGVISARLVENEQPVEYSQPLFIVDTTNTIDTSE